MTGATIADWVRTREPAPPDHLVERMLAVLGPDAARPAADAYEPCLAAGERLVSELLARDATDRSAALDLLTADALVSCAFEAAGDAPDSIDARAGDALARLSRLDAR
jgi:hypothetical protein